MLLRTPSLNKPIALLSFLLLCLLSCFVYASEAEPLWDEKQRKSIAALWIGQLPPLPADPSNRYADDARAAELGQQIFFDTRFSINNQISCASCHQPDHLFSDAKTVASGIAAVEFHTPSLLGVAYSPWLFWDGRADSLWRQALEPMEHANEHGGNRTFYAHLINTFYRTSYQAIFGSLPANMSDPERFPLHAGPNGDAAQRSAWENMNNAEQQAVNRVFANTGKALAAYQRKLTPNPSRFDRYAEAVIKQRWERLPELFNDDETAGLALFIGKANCTHCHNGPLFSNHEFHNIGLQVKAEKPADQGRIRGVQQALSNEFNCLGDYSDAGPGDCAELDFVKTKGIELQGAFRVPSLRNIADTAPYMHNGQFSTLAQVLEHYRQAPFTLNGKTELLPLALDDHELTQLEAFLKTLSGPINNDFKWFRAPAED